MKRSRAKPISPEINCPTCEGTGFPKVRQPEQPGRKIFPAPCPQCHGKGRISPLTAQAPDEPAAPPFAATPAE